MLQFNIADYGAQRDSGILATSAINEAVTAASEAGEGPCMFRQGGSSAVPSF